MGTATKLSFHILRDSWLENKSEYPQVLLFFTQIHATVDVYPLDAPGQRFLPLHFLTVLAPDRNKKSLRSTGKKWLKVTVVAFSQGVKFRDLQPAPSLDQVKPGGGRSRGGVFQLLTCATLKKEAVAEVFGETSTGRKDF